MKLKAAVTIQSFVIVALIALVGWLVYSQIPETEPASLNVVDGQIVTEPRDDAYSTNGDKIYLDIRGFENVDMSFSEVRQRFGIPYYEHSMSNNDVEYIRKDAFIEKACGWIKENITNNPNANSVLVRNGCVTLGMLVEDFKKYMER